MYSHCALLQGQPSMARGRLLTTGKVLPTCRFRETLEASGGTSPFLMGQFWEWEASSGWMSPFGRTPADFHSPSTWHRTGPQKMLRECLLPACLPACMHE